MVIVECETNRQHAVEAEGFRDQRTIIGPALVGGQVAGPEHVVLFYGVDARAPAELVLHRVGLTCQLVGLANRIPSRRVATPGDACRVDIRHSPGSNQSNGAKTIGGVVLLCDLTAQHTIGLDQDM